jgi:hypothetical protein
MNIIAFTYSNLRSRTRLCFIQHALRERGKPSFKIRDPGRGRGERWLK